MHDSNILLVASKQDLASMNILNNLMELIDFEPTNIIFHGNRLLFSKTLNAYLLVIECDLIRADFLDELSDDFNRLIFLSKHASESKLPSLLVHFPGNWTADNSMGGRPEELSIADPEVLKEVAVRLYQYKHDGLIPEIYTIGIEVTHHGPTIGKACTFIEIGSDAESWKDPNAGRVIAEVIIDSVKNLKDKKGTAKLGLGGPHYGPKFWSILIHEKEILMGHIAPKYVIDDLNKDTIRKAVSKSLLPIDCALIDWKGLTSKQRTKLAQILAELGLIYRRI
ncbi:MAG: hypothetical protein NDP13_00630 [Crenarchaeota archaeon]|nr:hypothetical protein [Thermoproteota archaeon]